MEFVLLVAGCLVLVAGTAAVTYVVRLWTFRRLLKKTFKVQERARAELDKEELEPVARDQPMYKLSERQRTILARDDDQVIARISKSARPSPSPVEGIRFAVYYPKEVVPEQWDAMLIYAYDELFREFVEEDAQTRLEWPGRYGNKVGLPTTDIALGTEIIVVPELPGFKFNPPADRFLYLENVHRREFRLRADPETQGFSPGTAVNGRVTFYMASIIIAEIPIWAFVQDRANSTGAAKVEHDVLRGLPKPLGLIGTTTGRPASDPSSRTSKAEAVPYNAIFVSYAHDDGTLVDRLSVAYKALGMSFLRDQEVLRSGEKWNARLLDLIEKADIFQLYWSDNARRSSYVEQEWRHALHQVRENFIRPVYWQKPMPKPPDELTALHFTYVPIDDHVSRPTDR